MKNEFAGCAWVHRKGKPSMLFRPDPLMHKLAHRTKYGTLYLIFDDLKIGKPFWIGRYFDAPKGSFVTWERELRARSIEFASGGQYFF